MKLLYWDRSLIHIIGSYLEYGENGILNLLSNKYYNKNYKLHINAFILNKKMSQWYCINFKFYISKVDCESAATYGHLNCLKYAHENGCPYSINDLLVICNIPKCKEYIEKKLK